MCVWPGFLASMVCFFVEESKVRSAATTFIYIYIFINTQQREADGGGGFEKSLTPVHHINRDMYMCRNLF